MANTTGSNPFFLDTADLSGPIHSSNVRVTSIYARNDDVAAQTITLTNKSGKTIFQETLTPGQEVERSISSWVKGIGTLAMPLGDAVVMVWHE